MKRLALAAALLASAACAHAPNPALGSPPERELITGSRIPQRLDASGTLGAGVQQVRIHRYKPGAEPDPAAMLRRADPALRIVGGG